MIYPNSISEFRILVSTRGEQRLQLRYVNMAQGYVGAWQDIPMVQEND
jgi:hypothetical protein